MSAPACTRTPVKECVPRTVETPRKARSYTFDSIFTFTLDLSFTFSFILTYCNATQVCQTVVDVFEDTTITERCQEVITTTYVSTFTF